MDDIWIWDSGACGNFCKYTKRLFNVEDIKERITMGNGKNMMAINVRSLKRQFIQAYSV
jgi:hypothetical protein